MTGRLGIYIHWPFCRSKCPYCGFYSTVCANPPQAEIVESYLEDVNYYAALADRRQVSTVFFGGGTPSLLTPANVEKIIDSIASCWHLSPDAEISMEANPNTHTPNLFKDLRQAGINRLSLGIQSLKADGLKILGRTHTVAEALAAAEEVLKVFDNHSADLIYGRPQLLPADWRTELAELCRMGFKHLSLYQLTIEDGTPFARKGLQPVSEDVAAAEDEICAEVTAAAGYRHYEVSNYAVVGCECRHNMIYWQGDDYVGIGEGAHGRLHILGQIYATRHRGQMQELTPFERAEEQLIMGLRLQEGINKAHFAENCGLEFAAAVNRDELQALVNQGLAEDTPYTFRLTTKGAPLLDYLLVRLVGDAAVSGDEQHHQKQKEQH